MMTQKSKIKILSKEKLMITIFSRINPIQQPKRYLENMMEMGVTMMLTLKR